jgi:hypothetical protein
MWKLSREWLRLILVEAAGWSELVAVSAAVAGAASGSDFCVHHSNQGSDV